MRRYSNEEEERVRMQELVREWTRSGFLEAAQSEALVAGLRVDLRRTNPFLRGGLALFTLLIVAALVGLVAVSLNVGARGAIAALAGLSGLACIAPPTSSRVGTAVIASASRKAVLSRPWRCSASRA